MQAAEISAVAAQKLKFEMHQVSDCLYIDSAKNPSASEFDHWPLRLAIALDDNCAYDDLRVFAIANSVEPTSMLL